MDSTIFSNCAGNPDCNCDSPYSNCAGCTTLKYSNCCGAGSTSNFNNLIGFEVPTTLQTLTAPAPTTSTPSTTEKITSTLAGIAGGLFGTKSATATAPTTSTTPAPERKVPTMVWVALAVLAVLLGIFLALKLKK